MTIHGDVRHYESIADSGNAMSRGFCPSCGTPLTSVTEARPGIVFIRAGALDEPDLMGPQVSIWTDTAPDWACIDPTIPKHPGPPPPAA